MTILLKSLIFVIFLLFLSGLFSGGETAITATSRAKLLALRDRYMSFRKVLDWLLKDRQKALTTILIANNLVNIAASSLATTLAVMVFQKHGVVLAVTSMTVLIVIFGEILPKSFALAKSEKVLFLTLHFIRFSSLVLSPFVWIIGGIVTAIGRLSKVDLSLQASFVTREEIEQVVTIGEASGALEESERRMIHGIISFEDTKVSEVMVPRIDMDVVDSDITIEELVPHLEEHGHSRIPIYEDSLDDIIGILYVKDLIGLLYSGKTGVKLASLKRDALFVPETMKVPDLFNIMKSRRIHMAVVVDEYGGTAGIITLEDLLEEIVGEIQDEYDHELPAIEEVEEGVYQVQGNMDLEDLSDFLGYPFESEDVESVGGLITDLSGDFPSTGSSVTYGPWEFTVLSLADHRVMEVELRKIDSEECVEDDD
ncbi:MULTISPECIES: hemolysin family protein [Dethiosulfovibrio]|uniref:Hemolysin family protein n=2 Tax=Dethiosulfovibrio TaxID=47054 RepID=A0ABS9ERP8_9BACT|nr:MULTISPECIES: hemolysin family protein [Dethiosulfovibrio]MCF4115057.1 hemolysin family protein [Dethiosulfovibrio russensis]MCF4143379.1 hemolysin family protein [Dethiosulfovibrio marinus]MCF4145502.1 hemolysin family protein [Dethiosulfovibrio acidaminovorans]